MDGESLTGSSRFDRKKFVGVTAAAAAAPAVATLTRAGGAFAAPPATELEEATIADLQAAMTAGSAIR
jgi:hypothetical protein